MSNEKLDRISERVYNASFVVTVILIFTASIGTAIARYSLQSDIELVPDNVFKFIKDVLWLFLSIYGRINFSQLGRYGSYCEQRYRQQFERTVRRRNACRIQNHRSNSETGC